MHVCGWFKNSTACGRTVVSFVDSVSHHVTRRLHCDTGDVKGGRECEVLRGQGSGSDGRDIMGVQIGRVESRLSKETNEQLPTLVDSEQ